MKKILTAILLVLIGTLQLANAEAKEVLDLQVKNTIQAFNAKVPGAEAFLNNTQGYLVIPNVYKAGFIVGGSYGEGALLVKTAEKKPDGKPVFKIADYYSILSASIGFQAGAQKQSLIIAFLTPHALQSFQSSNKWKVGVDGSIAIFNVGGTIDLSTVDFKKSIVAFAFGNQGLMAGISLDGSVFTKLKK